MPCVSRETIWFVITSKPITNLINLLIKQTNNDIRKLQFSNQHVKWTSITTCQILALKWLGTGRDLAILFNVAKSQVSTSAASKSAVLYGESYDPNKITKSSVPAITQKHNILTLLLLAQIMINVPSQNTAKMSCQRWKLLWQELSIRKLRWAIVWPQET